MTYYHTRRVLQSSYCASCASNIHLARCAITREARSAVGKRVISESDRRMLHASKTKVVSRTVAQISVTPGEICSNMAKSSWVVLSCIFLPISLSTLGPGLRGTGQFMDGRLILRVTGSRHIPTDLAIHHERTMRSLSYVWLHRVDKNAASDFSGASDCGNREAHHQSLKPAHIVSEDVTLASTRGVVVDDDVGFCGDGQTCGDAANGVHEEDFGDLISIADVSIRRGAVDGICC